MFAAKDSRGPAKYPIAPVLVPTLGQPLLLVRNLSTPTSDVFVLLEREIRS
jgi:hypothetical protein